MYEAPSPSTRQSAFPVIAMSPKAKGHLRYVGLKSEFSPSWPKTIFLTQHLDISGRWPPTPIKEAVHKAFFYAFPLKITKARRTAVIFFSKMSKHWFKSKSLSVEVENVKKIHIIMCNYIIPTPDPKSCCPSKSSLICHVLQVSFDSV